MIPFLIYLPSSRNTKTISFYSRIWYKIYIRSVDVYSSSMMNVEASPAQTIPGKSAETLVRSLSERRDEPDWMTEFRCSCLSRYLNLSGDAASRTPVESRLQFDDLSPFLNTAYEEPRQPSSDTNERVQALREQGVYFRPLRQALQQRPELIRSHFMQHAVQPKQDRIAALHGALWNSGTVVYVPRDVQVDLPLTVFHRNSSETRFLFPHQLIVAEAGSKLRFVEGCSAPDENHTETIAGCVELLIGPEASVRYSTLQNWGDKSTNITLKRAVLDRGASINWISGNIGSSFTDMIPTTVLNGKNASCRHLDFSLAGADQSHHTGATIHHRAPETESEAILRNAGFAGGETISTCRVTAEPGSHGSRCDISSHGRMIEQTAHTVTQTELDVREKHVEIVQDGGITEQSPEHQFYLRSRGVPQPRARLMLLNAFFKPVMEAYPTEFAVELRKQISELF